MKKFYVNIAPLESRLFIKVYAPDVGLLSAMEIELRRYT